MLDRAAKADYALVAYPQAGARNERFLNRELSWLQFNERVLSIAADSSVPLLERLRFLSIFSSNLDEFFMKRVGGLKQQVAAGIVSHSIDGRSAQEQLAAIRTEVIRLLNKRADVFEYLLKPGLAAEGILLLSWSELTASEKQLAADYFRKSIFPMLTPLAVDPGHPFPFISNLSQSLAATVRHPGREEKLFARVKTSLPVAQWFSVSAPAGTNEKKFVSFREIVMQHLADLFPGIEIMAAMPFRVTRSAEMDFADQEADDLLEMIEEGLRRRRFSQAVRLEIAPGADAWMLNFLREEMGLADSDIYEVGGEIDCTNYNVIANIDLPHLRYQPWVPQVPPSMTADLDMFSLVRDHDILVHHPYESFSATVARLVHEASVDPRVRAIKMTMYRIGDEDPLIPLLILAAENGKQVVCLIELQAHFDEERNIRWAQTMEDAGIHVVFGVMELKTHAKTILVVREEPDGIRTYCHIGTGNYHATTARLYTDLGLFTASSDYTEELAHFFNYLTGRSAKTDYQTLLVAPINMRERFYKMIKREIEHQQAGRPAHIVAKVNSLSDEGICEALYRASEKGVPVELIVRGLCCLRAQQPGLSDNIRVTSVVGRLLEHSRIFYFRNGADSPLDGEFYLGSADWMKRNLDHRVEIAAPIKTTLLREKCWEILDIIRHDETQAWDMQSDGSYRRRCGGNLSLGTHEFLMQKTKKNTRSGQRRKAKPPED